VFASSQFGSRGMLEEESNAQLGEISLHDQTRHCLGHVISKKGIEVDKAKIDFIADLSPPKSVKDIRSFVGHAGFYRCFIKTLARLPDP